MVFRALASLPWADGWCALHSLGLPEHAYKRVAEIDFLLVGPPGIFVIEVKGGGIRRIDRAWYTTNRYGDEQRLSGGGPFEQARSARFALEELLRKRDQGIAVPCWGWGVAFPDCGFADPGIEWNPSMVLDQTSFHDAEALSTALRRLTGFFTAKEPTHRQLSADELARLQRALAADFTYVPSLAAQASAVQAQLVDLTERQLDALWMAADNPRLLVRGGAGTGKTLVALESAKREALADRRVLFMCFNPILAASLRNRIQAIPGLEVASIHTFMMRAVAATPGAPPLPPAPQNLLDPWYRDALPAAYLAATARTERPPFDSLYVDEAQDVLSPAYLPALDALLAGGLAAGTWRFFFDPGLQAGIYGQMDPSSLTALEATRPAAITLADNCRNTVQVAEAVRLATGGDVGRRHHADGPEVLLESHGDEPDRYRRLSALLDRFAEEIGPGHVTVLIDGDAAAFARTPALSAHRLRPLDRRNAPKPTPDRATVCAIADFKGLENEVIIVTQLGVAAGEAFLPSLYVAMTRARVKLVILLPESGLAVLRRRMVDAATREAATSCR